MLSTILLVGLNHTTAPVSLREQAFPFICPRQETYAHLRAAFDPNLFSEFLLLATCNRTEIYAVTNDAARAASALRGVLLHETADATEALYELTDRAAVSHLFAVACGIDSLVLGEFEILGQVRQAYQDASEAQTVGPTLHALAQAALHAGKRARNETEIGQGARSVAYAAVTLARQTLGDLSGRVALVIGSGEMGRRAAENLSEDGACTVMVTSRTYEHASALAERIRAEVVPFDALSGALEQADVIISATRAPHIIVTAEMLAAAMTARRERALSIIDIALPRNVDPAAAQLENVQLRNLDDLYAVVAHTQAARAQAVAQVNRLIDVEVEALWEAHLTRRAAPLLQELYARAETIRQAELEKTFARLSHVPLTERERNIIRALSAGLVSKLLAAPTAQLKAHVSTGDGQAYLDALRELFALETTTETEI